VTEWRYRHGRGQPGHPLLITWRIASSTIPYPVRRLPASPWKSTSMFGLIGKMTAVPGQRDALVAIMLDGIGAMPGCLSYVVAAEPADPVGIWVTELWDSARSHQASLALPAVQQTVARARPLIAGFTNRVETVPIG